MREKDVERWVCRQALLRLGVRNWKLTVGNETGVPDRLFLIPGGRPLLIEFKLPGEPLRPKQGWWHEILGELEYDVEVHDNRERAFQAIAGRVEASRVSKKGDEVFD